MKIRFLSWIFIVFYFNSTNVFSQHISFSAVNFTPERNNNSLLAIGEDHLGYIWITSRGGGIYRYDGREFINFQHSDTNSNSLASNRAECILVDSSDILWIGTLGKGMDRFDPATGSFTHFRHEPGNGSSIASDTVTAILEDHLGNLWVGDYGGVDLLDRKTGKFTHYPYKDNDASSLSNNLVRGLYEDRKGTLWVACGSPFPREGKPNEGGLNRFNRTSGNFTRYLHDPSDPKSLETNKVKAMFEDSKGNFWIGTSGNGLHIMDREKGTFTHYYYDPEHPEKLSRPVPSQISYDHITFINEDKAGGIWIGTLACGINRYDPVSQKITHFGSVLLNERANLPLAKDTAAGFRDFSTWQALFSNDGTIWITTLLTWRTVGSYLYRANPFVKLVPFYPTSKPGANTFYYDADSVLWVGTDSGLIRKNLKLKSEKLYFHDSRNVNSLSNSTIDVIRADQNDNLWLGTYGGGVDRFDLHTNTVTSFRHDPKKSSSLINDTIWSMCMDHNNDLWVGTNNGIDKMNIRQGVFAHYKLGGIPFGNIVFCIREDQENQIWVGTIQGLYTINTASGMIDTILRKAAVKSICVDFKNDVWVGADTTGTGEQKIYRCDRGRHRLISFTDPNSKKQINNLFDILEDAGRNLWVSTSNAIIKINENRNGIHIYGGNSGVHPNNFGTGDNFRSRNGLLFFGDLKGYYSFFPDDLKGNSQPTLNFTGFRLNGKEVRVEEGGILKKPLWRTQEIRLSYNQNSFSFEFIGINYQAADEIQYLYRLENYDEDWHQYGTERRAFYFNIPPGQYLFHVRAFSVDGGTSDKSIRIIILPPWWKTWWAYAFSILLLTGAIWGLIYYRSQKLHRENRLLEEKVERRTNQLNQSLDELKATQTQLIQSEKMASLGELTAGIAHEIQNPLNFVNNFSEVNAELIAEMKEELTRGNMNEVQSLANDIEENEKKILHHGKRADAIVKGMLQHSRASTGQKEPTDLNALTDEYLRLSYHGLRAKDKTMNANMHTDFDPSIQNVLLIPQDIGRVLLNLFNNAFYAVTEKKLQQKVGFDPTVWVSTKKLGNKVEIRIRDNGMGIPKKIMDKIFQPFFTTKPTGSGTGLGLSLSYDIIKTHGGELRVESREGESAEFIILLPVV